MLGLDPGELFEIQVTPSGGVAKPASYAADASGEWRTRFPVDRPSGFAIEARRRTGEVATAQVGTFVTSVASPTASPRPAAAATPPPSPQTGVAAGVTPAAGPLGMTFTACFVDLPPAATGAWEVTRGSTVFMSGTLATPTSADGTACFSLAAVRPPSGGLAQGLTAAREYTLTLTVGATKKTLTFGIEPSSATGTNACTPATGRAGTAFDCVWFGLGPGGGVVTFTIGAPDGTSFRFGTVASVYADGTTTLRFKPGATASKGEWRITATASLSGLSGVVKFVFTE